MNDKDIQYESDSDTPARQSDSGAYGESPQNKYARPKDISGSGFESFEKNAKKRDKKMISSSLTNVLSSPPEMVAEQQKSLAQHTEKLSTNPRRQTGYPKQPEQSDEDDEDDEQVRDDEEVSDNDDTSESEESGRTEKEESEESDTEQSTIPERNEKRKTVAILKKDSARNEPSSDDDDDDPESYDGPVIEKQRSGSYSERLKDNDGLESSQIRVVSSVNDISLSSTAVTLSSAGTIGKSSTSKGLSFPTKKIMNSVKNLLSRRSSKDSSSTLQTASNNVEQRVNEPVQISTPSRPKISIMQTPQILVDSATLAKQRTENLESLIGGDKKFINKMQKLVDYYSQYKEKLYYEGWMYKKNDLGSDGQPVAQNDWRLHYVELRGASLTFWDASLILVANNIKGGYIDDHLLKKITKEQIQVLKQSSQDAKPYYLNINDSLAEWVGIFQKETHGKLLKSGIISLNTAGANRYFLQPAATIEGENPEVALMHDWLAALRISIFEDALLGQLYTDSLIDAKEDLKLLQNTMFMEEVGPSRFSGRVDKIKCTSLRNEGWLQVRVGGETQWRRYWVVLERDAAKTDKDGGQQQLGKGRMIFYEDKNDADAFERKRKKRRINPLKLSCFELINVGSAHAIFPDKPELINLSNIFKVEDGSLLVGEKAPPTFLRNPTDVILDWGINHDPQFAASKKKVISQFTYPSFINCIAESQHEMIKWILSIWCVYGLNGKDPYDLEKSVTEMMTNPSLSGKDTPISRFIEDIVSPFRFDPLFLTVQDVAKLDMRSKKMSDYREKFLALAEEKAKKRKSEKKDKEETWKLDKKGKSTKTTYRRRKSLDSTTSADGLKKLKPKSPIKEEPEAFVHHGRKIFKPVKPEKAGTRRRLYVKEDPIFTFDVKPRESLANSLGKELEAELETILNPLAEKAHESTKVPSEEGSRMESANHRMRKVLPAVTRASTTVESSDDRKSRRKKERNKNSRSRRRQSINTSSDSDLSRSQSVLNSAKPSKLDTDDLDERMSLIQERRLLEIERTLLQQEKIVIEQQKAALLQADCMSQVSFNMNRSRSPLRNAASSMNFQASENNSVSFPMNNIYSANQSFSSGDQNAFYPSHNPTMIQPIGLNANIPPMPSGIHQQIQLPSYSNPSYQFIPGPRSEIQRPVTGYAGFDYGYDTQGMPNATGQYGSMPQQSFIHFSNSNPSMGQNRPASPTPSESISVVEMSRAGGSSFRDEKQSETEEEKGMTGLIKFVSANSKTKSMAYDPRIKAMTAYKPPKTAHERAKAAPKTVNANASGLINNAGGNNGVVKSIVTTSYQPTQFGGGRSRSNSAGASTSNRPGSSRPNISSSRSVIHPTSTASASGSFRPMNQQPNHILAQRNHDFNQQSQAQYFGQQLPVYGGQQRFLPQNFPVNMIPPSNPTMMQGRPFYPNPGGGYQ